MIVCYEDTEFGRTRRRKKFVKKDRAVAWATDYLVSRYGNEQKIRLAKELSRIAATQLYLIRCGDHVKIGSSSNANDRFRQIQSNFPLRLELIAAIRVDEAKKVERALHREFMSKRVRGEWFLLTEQDIESIKSRYQAPNPTPTG